MKLILQAHAVSFLIATTSIIVPYIVSAEDGFHFSEITSEELHENVKFESSRVVTAEVGKLLLFPLPRNSIKNNAFEAKRTNYTKLPSWLFFEKKTGLFMGVPLDEDVETLQLTIYNVPSQKEDLTVNVIHKSLHDTRKCVSEAMPKIVDFLIHIDIHQIKPAKRISIISNVAKYLGISTGSLRITPYSERNESSVHKPLRSWSSFLKPTTGIASTRIQAQIGCGFGLWGSLNQLAKNLKLHSADGTLSSMLGFPLISWKVDVKFLERTKRDVTTADDYDQFQVITKQMVASLK